MKEESFGFTKISRSIPVGTELLWDAISLNAEIRINFHCTTPIGRISGEVKPCGWTLSGGALKVTKKGKIRIARYPNRCENPAHLYQI